MTLSSLATPLLITTTLLLASFCAAPLETEAPVGGEPAIALVPSAAALLLARASTAAAISSGTLFLKSFLGFIRQYLPNQADNGGYARRKPQPISAQEVAQNVLGLWACYFVALELGGVRASVLMLACMAAGLGLEGVGLKGLIRRKAVLVSVALAAAWDLWNGSQRGGGLGTAAAYIVLLAGAAGVRSPWNPETKSTAHGNRVSLVAACILGAVGALGWLSGLGAAALPEVSNKSMVLGILACVAGAAGIMFGKGISAGAACGSGVFAAITGGYLIGLIRGHDLLNEAGLGGLALAGKPLPSTPRMHNLTPSKRSPSTFDLHQSLTPTGTRTATRTGTPTPLTLTADTTTMATAPTQSPPSLLPPLNTFSGSLKACRWSTQSSSRRTPAGSHTLCASILPSCWCRPCMASLLARWASSVTAYTCSLTALPSPLASPLQS